jgi:predicted ribosome quality control (RQC) complex YloA/Tae2 family protein
MKKIVFHFDSFNNDIEYIIGQNANENFKIIDDANNDTMNDAMNDAMNDSNKFYMWFHIDGYPSCHVVCSIPDNLSKKDLLKVIKRGALCCKEHSKYRTEKSVSVIYTYLKNVTKTDVIGTVITTNTKSIKV